ncbi:hypothetical protein J6590_037073 [Homalodisca vitripennis]|nr:hypothetical protein J6590_037073 [Homalodisca vitripennis]
MWFLGGARFRDLLLRLRRLPVKSSIANSGQNGSRAWLRVFTLCGPGVFLRLVGNEESLSKFVAEVRDTGRVLRLDIPESTVVTTILEGLNPEERSRLVFAGRPSTFSELDRLCIASRSVQFADRKRLERNIHSSIQPSRAVTAVHNPAAGPHHSGGLRLPICYACGERGHTRRECPRRYRIGPKN